jgi:hypothetical protein
MVERGTEDTTVNAGHAEMMRNAESTEIAEFKVRFDGVESLVVLAAPSSAIFAFSVFNVVSCSR